MADYCSARGQAYRTVSPAHEQRGRPAADNPAPEVDPDFLEPLRYQDAPEPEPPWDF